MFFSLSVQTVCQDSGGDEADDEEQQVGCPLAAHLSSAYISYQFCVTTLKCFPSHYTEAVKNTNLHQLHAVYIQSILDIESEAAFFFTHYFHISTSTSLSLSSLCCLVQAEYDAMLQEFAGEGIPLLASSVPADNFAPFLNDLLPLIMSKAVSPDLRMFPVLSYRDNVTADFLLNAARRELL